jgi:beta-glucosidase
MRAHGAAVQAYRAGGGKKPIGIVVNIEPKYPASSSPEDAAAAARADAYMNRQYLDPIFFGKYPDELAGIFGEAWPDHPASDFDAIRTPVDFVGINYYTRGVMRHATPEREPYLRAVRVPQKDAIHTALDWEVYPDGLTDTLTRVRDRYGPIPLYVTENGAAFYDPPTVDGAAFLEDPLRVGYYRSHLAAARNAIEKGVDLRGYFAWSLLDNFEWSHGFTKRFGIVHVDYATQKRTPKASAHFYSEVIRTNGANV